MTEFCWFNGYCWLHFFLNYNFGQSFISELLASIIGVGLGAFGALKVNQYLENQKEKERRTKILVALKKELRNNRRELLNLKEGDYEIGTLSEKLSIETWNTFSEGGELEWIKEPDLLLIFSGTYFHLRSLMGLCDKSFELSKGKISTVDLANLTRMNKEIKEKVSKVIEKLNIVIDYLEKTSS